MNNIIILYKKDSNKNQIFSVSKINSFTRATSICKFDFNESLEL